MKKRTLSMIFNGAQAGGVEKRASAGGRINTETLSQIAYAEAAQMIEKNASCFIDEQEKQAAEFNEMCYHDLDESELMIKEAMDEGFSAEQVAQHLISQNYNRDEVIEKVASVQMMEECIAAGQIIAQGYNDTMSKLAEEIQNSATAGEGEDRQDSIDELGNLDLNDDGERMPADDFEQGNVPNDYVPGSEGEEFTGPIPNLSQKFPSPGNESEGETISVDQLKDIVSSARDAAKRISGGGEEGSAFVE